MLLKTLYVRNIEQKLSTKLDIHEFFCCFFTGSYDHTVKLWDTRSNECTLTVDHGDPVESVLLYPNCGMCVSSGTFILAQYAASH